MATRDDIFFSYPRADRDAVLPLVNALRATGLTVFLDESGIDEFEGITSTIRSALAGARLFLAYYSLAYPTRPACQWELLTAFRAASALGRPSERILVINPEQDPGHIQPVPLRDARFAASAEPSSMSRLVRRVQEVAADSPGCLGDSIEAARPVWRPDEHLGSDRFVGRVNDFWRLHDALHAYEYPATHDEAGGGQAVIIGLGGVGKTLLAEQYARRFGSFYPGGIYWFTAAASHSPDSAATHGADADEAMNGEIRAQHYQQVATALGLDSARLDPLQIREAARRHIEETGKPCLWVVDDIPGRLAPAVIRELAAPHPLGRTVMTTRWRGYPLAPVDVDVLRPAEAYHLLTSARAPADAAEEDAARTLTDRLGSHSLAIDLIRGCLADQPGLTYAELLGELADTQHGDAFQRLVDDLFTHIPTDHTRDIAATFTRSLQHLDENALTLLRVTATLAPAPLPERLLTAISATLHNTDDKTALRMNRRALQAAQRRSLVRQNGTQPPSWFVHALVSRTLTLQQGADALRPSLHLAAVAATTRLMRPVYTPGRLDLADIAPHARALTEEADSDAVLTLLDSVGRYDAETGQLAGALHHYKRQVDASTALHGHDHPRTIGARSNLASTRLAAGNYREAIELMAPALAASVRIWGPDHPNVPALRGNLASAHRAAGDFRTATGLQEQALAESARILGPEDPLTLLFRNNLAGIHQEAGDLGQAISLYEQILTDSERVLGPDHPTTLNLRHNLASARRSAGDLTRAVPAFEQILTDRHRVLGPDHPDTLTSRIHVGDAYRTAGHEAEALPLLTAAATDSERVLGPDHPITLHSRHSLALCLLGTGDLGRAISLLEGVLADRDRILSPDHPDILVSRTNLADAYRMTGRPNRAIPLLARTVVDAERVLGPDHPRSLTARHNLADAHEAAGDPLKAIRLLEHVLVDRERVLGPSHPDVLASRNSLAGAHLSAGNLERAAPLAEQVFADAERILGPDHPNTLIARANLADVHFTASGPVHAIPLLEQALARHERVLGADHPRTWAVRQRLAELRGKGI
ncbi:tetratricopeptide repeat protein [Streptomyces sp. NPDC006923]|uniref:tetratricopeptide repeat protein n=1 Tax=Streptomyces sp. NPDC006923 TaxID=3155355 RepID=UPI0033DE9CF1